jgi:hypothetical protein
MITLIGAGCSHVPATNSSSVATGSAGANNTAANLDKVVQFAKCMRSNGVSNFPDPNTSGQFTIDAIANGSGVDTSSAAFAEALSACKDLEPPGFTGSTRSSQQQEASLKFAQCVRDNGVRDFPDPTPDGPLVDTNRVPSAATSGGMSMLNAAMRTCRSFARAAGVTGGK